MTDENKIHHISDHPSFGLLRNDTDGVDKLQAREAILAMQAKRLRSHLGLLAGIPDPMTVSAIERIRLKRLNDTR